MAITHGDNLLWSIFSATHSHVDRVRKLALTIGGQEGLGEESLQTIELAALLHDVGDHKYACMMGAHTTKYGACLSGVVCD